MKNKKGFSLIELVGVIVIIGLILIVAIPAVTKLLKSNNNKEYENYLKIIKAGALRYADELKDDLGNSNNSGCITIDLNDLIEKGYIKKFNDKKITCTGDIRLDNKKGNVKALVNLTCTNNKRKETFGPPEEFNIDDSCIAYIPGSGGNNQGGNGGTGSGDNTTNSNTLASQILANNTALSDEGIDFSLPSSDTNGKGLYYTNKNTEGNEYTYYFRGDIDNNYVKFGKDKDENDLYWRIVRINEDGSVRLIYQGTSATATGDDATIGTSTFNTGSIVGQYNAYVGYMYGLIGIFSITSPVCVTYDGANDKAVNSTATYGAKPECEKAKGVWATTEYEATHANVVDSEVKKMLDKWYENNLLNYSSYIADAGFCNDRSVASTAYTWASNDTALGDSRNTTYYGAYNRLYTNKTPQFACPNADNDLFTTSTSTKGNKKLTNPIGLITADEVWYAGAITTTNIITPNKTHYLYTGAIYWTMSPWGFVDASAVEWDLESRGYLNTFYVGHSDGVRPVVNLRSGVELSTELPSGCTKLDGTANCPYIIKTN